jgi:SanA protein
MAFKLIRVLKRKWSFRKLLKRASVFALVLIVFAHILVEQTTKKRIYASSKAIPENNVGLLLGTNKYLNNGSANLYYKYRIEAAARLYKSGKIKYLIVSGDNSRKKYNEPAQMRDDLIKKGVPRNCIFLDYAGFRTLDSVVRAKEIFGQTKMTIISQAFHNKRALFIAKGKGIDAVAYNAKSVSKKYGWKVHVRELFARVKLLIDLYVINKQPKFLGEKIIMPN